MVEGEKERTKVCTGRARRHGSITTELDNRYSNVGW